MSVATFALLPLLLYYLWFVTLPLALVWVAYQYSRYAVGPHYGTLKVLRSETESEREREGGRGASE